MKTFALLSLIISLSSCILAESAIISLSEKVDAEARTKNVHDKAAKEKLAQDVLNKLLQTKSHAIVKFHSRSCGPCNRIAPLYEKLARQFNNDVTFITIESTSYAGLIHQYKVQGNPTFITFKNGVELARVVGAYDDKLKDIVNKAVELAKKASPQPTILLAQN